MALETKLIDLAGGPVNLIAHSDIAAALVDGRPPERGIKLFLQNVSPRSKVYYRETMAEPETSDKGHCINVGDGLELRLWATRPAAAWVWAASTGCIAVTEKP